MNRFQQEINTLRKQLAEANATVGRLQQSVHNLHSSINNLEKERNRLEAENHRLRRAVLGAAERIRRTS